ncbi:hypothetical protein GCM10017786_54570 [Amycolatopsis deserti]|uniref:Uncharacterized protein n=1 Tax=Amycolatopsis deserti TaxID=185696 RepID=A0ABQ3J9R0_9PSEU|nr:hypothetical protein GCM10017786_54570 [Amycolatopsis deserti]
MSHTNTSCRSLSAAAMSRHTYDENGVPCNNTTGGPEPEEAQRTVPFGVSNRSMPGDVTS